MPGKRISALDQLLAAELAADDDFVVFDTSLGVTKRISKADLALATLGLPVTFVVLSTPGSSTYTVPAGVSRLVVECQGGGGGGGFADANASPRVAGGGRAGSWAFQVFDVVPGQTFTAAVGIGGPGGTTGAGTTGGTTSFSQLDPAGGTPLAAPGGTGGLVGATGLIGSPTANAAVVGALISTPGAGAELGIVLDANVRASGSGGNSRYGAGGRAQVASLATTAINGDPGTGAGAGGAGAVGGTGTAANGGAGAPGLIKIWEIG